MNVLFVTHCKVDPTKGGTERITTTLALGLSRLHSCKCYSLYELEEPASKPKYFEKEYFWQPSNNEDINLDYLKGILIKNNIDIIIIQGLFIHTKRFKNATKDLKCKIIFSHHFEPGAENVFFNFKDILSHKTSTLKHSIYKVYQILLYPFLKIRYKQELRYLYQEVYECADKIVLLSEKYILPYQKFASIYNYKKFYIIPNSLSFNIFASRSDINKKEKIVLIVSRFDDRHKKISCALKIWREVKKNPNSIGWKLMLIGHGKDEEKYKRIVSQDCIKDVYFLGRKNPIEYYRKAAIFMMTSCSESWGLTLTEAQQMGCIPIAFNSYPTVSDIITDCIDGYIIENNNIKAYSEKLINLISDANTRKKMATQAILNCQRYTQNVIINRWFDLFLSIKD